ncbi:MAG: PhoH family protein, partial [Chlamydiia bacterium]|nr:PhoH family protein [Chlamydiia bacterium]
MPKTFVLDTNVLIYDPESVIKFPRHDVIIPVAVLEELDKLKRLMTDVGKNARAVFRFLSNLHTLGEGDFHKGIKIKENDSCVRIMYTAERVPDFPLALDVGDNRIIYSAYALQKQGKHVVFVSKDFAARIKSEAIGIETEDYENLKFSYETIY